MKTFKITISQVTAKQKVIKLHELFVNSENSLNELKSAYYKKYTGFSTCVEELKVVEVFENEIKEVKEQKVASSLRSKKDDIGNIESYYAEIHQEDMEVIWKEREKKIELLQKEMRDVEKDFEAKVREKFNLKTIEYFKVEYSGVSFKFYPSWFNFKQDKK